ncbi:uncharacterized protein PAC_17777 [Phialocephala subalpina]|uniref:FAD dependent oxidoreductase domain-containing protein n=1 Tax=Phialocephala subalpina TaxID=576137 RepID=A0A1L7XSF1_9HELO|nr:uncharacterized protein PAC_17777 [Phialocephala subalpina]
MPVEFNQNIIDGSNFSPLPTPKIHPTNSSSRILVLGGGVTGLTTAWALLDCGYKVTILAKEWSTYSNQQRLTSQIAGALWEYPPAACGQHTDAISLGNSKRLCMVGYKIWESIAADPELAALSGVKMQRSAFFFTSRIEEDRAALLKMRELERCGVNGFQRNTKLIEEHDVGATFGAVDAYEHLAPIIDTDTAMKWIMRLVSGKGANFVTETLRGDLFSQECDLRTRFDADAIVNATGLASGELVGDGSCFPVRGALIRVINDGETFNKISTALVVPAGDSVHGKSEMVFIVPRNDNILILGGIAQPNEANLDLTLESPVIQRMRQRCESFLPSLKNARLDPEYPLAQGLRPFRTENVRVERELKKHRGNDGLPSNASRIIHSYGHGGAGWTLAFGCAEDVVGLVEEALVEDTFTEEGWVVKKLPRAAAMVKSTL